jgi:hypothetical protein
VFFTTYFFMHYVYDFFKEKTKQECEH